MLATRLSSVSSLDTGANRCREAAAARVSTIGGRLSASVGGESNLGQRLLDCRHTSAELGTNTASSATKKPSTPEIWLACSRPTRESHQPRMVNTNKIPSAAPTVTAHPIHRTKTRMLVNVC
jgi:hypothetical protein